MPDRRALIAGATLVAVSVLAPIVEPHRMLAKELPLLRLEEDIPKQFGDWRIDDSLGAVLPSPDVQRQLDQVYSQQLSRTYVNSAGTHVMLVVAYGEDQVGKTSVAHLPDACYPAQGFTVSPRGTRPVGLDGRAPLSASRLMAVRSTRYEPVTYWTVVGTQTFSSDYERRMRRLTSSLEGVIPDGMLVRISSIDKEEARAYAVHDEFSSALYAALPAALKPRMFGRGS